MTNLMSDLLKYLLTIVYMMLCGLWTGWVIKTLWWWFIYPWLHVQIPLLSAIGLDLIITLMAMPHIPRSNEQQHEMYVFVVVLPLMALIFGWVFKAVLQ